jgi:hypothetical protein
MSENLIVGGLIAAGVYLLLKGNDEPVPIVDQTPDTSGTDPITDGTPIQNVDNPVIDTGIGPIIVTGTPKITYLEANALGAYVEWSGPVAMIQVTMGDHGDVYLETMDKFVDGHYYRTPVMTFGPGAPAPYICMRAVDANGVVNNNESDYICVPYAGVQQQPVVSNPISQPIIPQPIIVAPIVVPPPGIMSGLHAEYFNFDADYSFGWNPYPGAVAYYFRVLEVGQPENSAQMYTIGDGYTSTVVRLQRGKQYSWWVHPVMSDGSYLAATFANLTTQ